MCTARICCDSGGGRQAPHLTVVVSVEAGHVGDTGLGGSARIAGRREQRATLRRLRQAPRQSVLPAPAPHHQHLHLPGERRTLSA